MHPPCKDCKERYLGCHDRCPRYKEFKAKIANIKSEMSKVHDIEVFEGERSIRWKKNQR